MACVYRHIRLDKNEVFYIGIGKTSKRAYDNKNGRSKYWKNIVNITDYEIDIIKNDLSWEDACELEQILISWYGRKDLGLGNLVNMTDGGEGNIGRQLTLEQRKSISDRMKGEKHWYYGKSLSEEHKIKMSENRKGENGGFYGKKHTNDTKLKISSSNKHNHSVIQLNLLGDVIRIWDTHQDAANEFKIRASNIINVCLKKPGYYKCGGFKWEFNEKNKNI